VLAASSSNSRFLVTFASPSSEIQAVSEVDETAVTDSTNENEEPMSPSGTSYVMNGDAGSPTAESGTDGYQASLTAPVSVNKTPVVNHGDGVSTNTKSLARFATAEWLSSLVCRSFRADNSGAGSQLQQPSVLTSREAATEPLSYIGSLKQRVWAEIEEQAIKLSNPDVQFARLI
jgi:hypothetical protein